MFFDTLLSKPDKEVLEPIGILTWLAPLTSLFIGYTFPSIFSYLVLILISIGIYTAARKCDAFADRVDEVVYTGMLIWSIFATLLACIIMLPGISILGIFLFLLLVFCLHVFFRFLVANAYILAENKRDKRQEAEFDRRQKAEQARASHNAGQDWQRQRTHTAPPRPCATAQAFATLGISPTSDKAAIKAAYRKLAMRYHPDRPTGDEAKFKEISSAYKTLKNIDKTP